MLCTRRVRMAGPWGARPGTAHGGARENRGSRPCATRLLLQMQKCRSPWGP